MRPRHLGYDQCIHGGVAWLCKHFFLAHYSAIPRGQDSQLQVPDHAYTIVLGARDGLNKIHVHSRIQLLSCPGHIQSSRVEPVRQKMAGPIGHRREKEMKREQIAKYIHEI